MGANKFAGVDHLKYTKSAWRSTALNQTLRLKFGNKVELPSN